MVQLSFTVLLALAAASSTRAAPLSKRIAQTISASTTKWEQACLAAGGGLQCNPVSVAAFTTLLAAAGPCDQQNAADSMIDLAKTLSGDTTQMIALSQVFAQQPRNTPTSLSVPYCQQAPKNSELTGLFQCQFAGANPTTFVGGVAVGGTGTIPFGMSSPLSPAGSCPAHTQGPIADGTQLSDITQSPGSGSSSANTGSSSGSSSSNAGETGNSSSSSASAECDSATATIVATVTASPTSVASTVAPTPTAASTGSSSSFSLQNGQDAQALNAKFATLTAGSSCTAGENACIGTAFAQCLNGKFVTTSCAATLTCAALPLVNSRGTSITCTTQADALARIQATGATGGITGA